MPTPVNEVTLREASNRCLAYSTLSPDEKHWHPLPDRWQRLVRPPKVRDVDHWIAERVQSMRPLAGWALSLAILRVCRAWIDDAWVVRMIGLSCLDLLDHGLAWAERNETYTTHWQRSSLPINHELMQAEEQATRRHDVSALCLLLGLRGQFGMHPLVPGDPRPANLLSLGRECTLNLGTAVGYGRLQMEAGEDEVQAWTRVGDTQQRIRTRFHCCVVDEFERILCVDHAFNSDWDARAVCEDWQL